MISGPFFIGVLVGVGCGMMVLGPPLGTLAGTPRADADVCLPSSKLQVLPLIVKFGFAGRSVAVFTESLGSQRHHGNIALLVNEHSASATETVADFASECQLAALVGTKTAGRLVATSAFKVGFGYRLVIPVATYFTCTEQISKDAVWRQR